MKRARLAGAAVATLAWLAAPAWADGAGLVVAGPDGAGHVLSPDVLHGLPHAEVTVGQGPGAHRFEGPLLWAVLGRAAVIDPALVHGQVRQTVLLTGRDGYTAILALGEIAPEFEGKPVIVAESMDGQALGPDHLRVVVPGDKRGGRGVHDLVRIGVANPAP